MRFWQSLKRSWEMWVAAPTPSKVLYFVLACGLAFGLAAAIARLEFGSSGERQVMDFIDGLITVITIVGAPVLLMGLAMFVVHQITRGRQNEIFGPPKKRTPG